MGMASETKLLTCSTLSDFIATLRGDMTDGEMVARLAPFGRTSAAAVRQHRSRGTLNSYNQVLYARAFDLSENARLHLQKLAAEAAGLPSVSGDVNSVSAA